MAQKAVPTALKDTGGKRVCRYRDTDGKSYNATITVRTSATVVTLVVKSGFMKRTIAGVPVATTMKQTNVFYFV